MKSTRPVACKSKLAGQDVGVACVDVSESGSGNIYKFLPFISFYPHDHIPRPHILKLVKYDWQAAAVNIHCKHFVTHHFVYISNIGQN